jgi:putative ABC transport system permease protein
MTTFVNDIRYGFRMLARNPGFTAVAVLIMALGIGANTSVFSVFDRVILQLLPVENPRELVLIEIDGDQAPGMANSDNHCTVYSYPQYQDFRDRAEVFSGMLARTSAPLVFTHGSEAHRATGELVSGNFFNVLGIRAAHGRLFSDEDDRREGGHPVAVISHAFWQRYFGGREDIVSEQVLLNGIPMTIIGVAPSEFTGAMTGQAPDVYITLAMRKQIRPVVYASDRLPERMVRTFNILARLRPRVTLQQASAAMQGIWRGIQEQELEELSTRIYDRDEFLARSLRLIPAWQGIHTLRRAIEKPLLSVTALAVLVLLIACVNVAGLLVTRAVARRREIAVRMALGAARRNLICQVLLECLILGLLGGMAGLLVAFGTTKLLGVLVKTGELTHRTILFNFVLALVTALLFGLVPAWQASRTRVASALKDQTAGAGLARGQARFRRGAVIIQIALSTLLLVAAGLFTKTLYNLRRFDPGFRTENLLSFTLDPALSGYDGQRSRLLYDRVIERLQSLPGVKTVGAAVLPVLGNDRMTSSLKIERYQVGEGEHVNTSRNVVSAGYFETLGISFVMGRRLNEHDHAGTARVAIVNEAFVSRYCDGENPIGRKISFGSDSLDIKIVGVVKNQKNANLREPTKHFVYTPYAQEDNVPSMTFYLWCQHDEAAMGPEIRHVVRELDPHLPVSRMYTVRARREEVLKPERTVALLACAFAAIAVTLAAVGSYGLLAYNVVRRTREIGIRVALGAQRVAIFRLVFREALTCFGVGLAIGIPLALALGRYLESQLFGLQASDPAVTVGSAFTLGLAVSLAALVPARRAAKIDPMEALRYE